ncbi:MAG: hypothetical protein U9R75_00915 [Candidatus Thermoplasmatota archaeon]|nr:hypothetical protein [Candidatus Thermoplasmatota archaeon]
MKRIFLVSFDHHSDRLLDHIVTILEGAPYEILYRTYEMTDYSTLGKFVPEWNEEEIDEGEVLDEDRLIYGSLSGIRDPVKNRVSPHILKPSEIELVDRLEENISRGDLVISFLSSPLRESPTIASYFSSRIISKEAFSICFISKRGKFKDIKEVEDLNREFLDLSMRFHGITALSPNITRSGNYIDIAHLIRHLAQMTFSSGVINLDQADLLVTSRAGSILVMTWGAARPGGRPAETSVKDALSNRLCDIELSTVRKALVNVVGSKALTLEDSLVASEVLRKRIRPNARLIWGVNIVQDVGDDMEVFLILSTTPMELLLHWYSHQRK